MFKTVPQFELQLATTCAEQVNIGGARHYFAVEKKFNGSWFIFEYVLAGEEPQRWRTLLLDSIESVVDQLRYQAIMFARYRTSIVFPSRKDEPPLLSELLRACSAMEQGRRTAMIYETADATHIEACLADSREALSELEVLYTAPAWPKDSSQG